MTTTPRYILISPVRNEEALIEGTLRSIVNQTVKPLRWVIVSNNSTDRTDEIVARYARQYPFIQHIQYTIEGRRNFGAKVNAFNRGCAAVKHLDYDFLANLDGDMTLGADYMEQLLLEFARNPRLGVAGPMVMEKVAGAFRPQPNCLRHVCGGCQMFRRACLEQIGGYLPLRDGGEDSAADIMARMQGWEATAFPHLRIYQNRQVGSTMGGLLRARFKMGLTDYDLGKHPLFICAKALRRLTEPPYVLSSLCRLGGYLAGHLDPERRQVSPEFVRFVRREEMKKLLLFH